LFNRNQAIRAMVLAGRLAIGCGDEDPFVIGWREEQRPPRRNAAASSFKVTARAR
jgi:hypothetical protein